MATSSILKEVKITKKEQADKFIKALMQSEAWNKENNDTVEVLKSNTLVTIRRYHKNI